MVLSTTVSQRKHIKRKAPRGFLKRVFKRQKPHLRLETSGDLLMHLNCLLFVHRLAEESRTNACENKCGIIKKEHVLAAAKVPDFLKLWSSVFHQFWKILGHYLFRYWFCPIFSLLVWDSNYILLLKYF
uniref:Centromere protein W n=1 Tax=Equus caballus TaxID=9796 RepID=A0A9L0R1H9_HORSE